MSNKLIAERESSRFARAGQATLRLSLGQDVWETLKKVRTTSTLLQKYSHFYLPHWSVRLWLCRRIWEITRKSRDCYLTVIKLKCWKSQVLQSVRLSGIPDSCFWPLAYWVLFFKLWNPNLDDGHICASKLRIEWLFVEFEQVKKMCRYNIIVLEKSFWSMNSDFLITSPSPLSIRINNEQMSVQCACLPTFEKTYKEVCFWTRSQHFQTVLHISYFLTTVLDLEVVTKWSAARKTLAAVHMQLPLTSTKDVLFNAPAIAIHQKP